MGAQPLDGVPAAGVPEAVEVDQSAVLVEHHEVDVEGPTVHADPHRQRRPV